MTQSVTTSRTAPPPGRKHDAGDMTREMTVLDIVTGRDKYRPRHENPTAVPPRPVGEGTRLIAVPPRANATRVIDIPARASAPVVPPVPQPVAPVPWWKALLMRIRGGR